MKINGFHQNDGENSAIIVNETKTMMTVGSSDEN